MYWTLQNLKDGENKQYILHNSSICTSIFSAATVSRMLGYVIQVPFHLLTAMPKWQNNQRAQLKEYKCM
jgi:hypothetical protein